VKWVGLHPLKTVRNNWGMSWSKT